MSRRARWAGFGLAAAAAVVAATAFGQPHPLPQPGQGQPRPPPGQGQPPPGRPRFMPSRPPPPDSPEVAAAKKAHPKMGNWPVALPHPAEAEAEHVDEENCPGHGPNDPPPPMNLWHGMIMVNNERALEGSFVNRLLFRYESEENPCDPRNEPPPFAATVLNFAVLGFILYRFGKKPLAEALVKRRQTIMAEIDNATRLKEEAEARLVDYEEKLENIHDTLEEVRAEFVAQGEAERAHILAEAEERRARLRRDAEFRIEQERKSARTELLQEAVEKSVAAAEKVVRERIQPADQERLAEEFLRGLGAAMAGANKAGPLRAGGAS